MPPAGFPPAVAPPATTLPTQVASARPRLLRYPEITEWLQYCDRHPDRKNANLGYLTANFLEKGFRHINQLVSKRVDVDNLAGWLSIAPGTADYIIGLAEEDCLLVVEGNFSMTLDENEEGAGDN
jgi:hypothetical protein